MLRHANGKTAHDVDEQNQNTGHGIAAHKLAGTVHGAEEVGLFLHFGAAALGFVFVDQARIQVGIHSHLLAGHGIQGEARRHFGNALGAFGDHHKVDHHQDGKHDQAHGKVAANQEVAKGLNHGAGSARAGVAFEQHHAGGGHVERQAHQRGEQQHRREGGKVQWPHHVRSHHHDHQGDGDIECEKGIEQPGRDGQHHQRQNGHHQQRGGNALEHGALAACPLAQVVQCGVHAALLARAALRRAPG